MTGVWEHLTEECQSGGIWVRLAAMYGRGRVPAAAAPVAPRCARCGAYCQACTAAPAGWAELPAEVRSHLDVTDAVQVRDALTEMVRPELRRPRRVGGDMRDPTRRAQRVVPDAHDASEALLRRSEPLCRDSACAERGRHPSHGAAA